MRKAIVNYNKIIAGIISEYENANYEFVYDDNYFSNNSMPPVSVTLPKSKQQHLAKELFPFFFNMLSEGVNRKIQCRILKIDEEDDFGLLLKTGANETIGAITVKEINET